MKRECWDKVKGHLEKWALIKGRFRAWENLEFNFRKKCSTKKEKRIIKKKAEKAKLRDSQ